jgi:hypothetical protein
MKKCVTLMICAFLSFSQGFPAAPGQKERKDEFNTKVTVRVFDRDTQVENLKKEDFTVLENNKPVALRGFEVTRKTLSPASARTFAGRFFVLEFYLHHYSAVVRKNIDFVFHRILGEKDRLLIVAGGRTLFFAALPDKTRAIRIIEEMLQEQAALTRQQMEAEITAMGKFIDEVRTQARQDVDPNAGIGYMTGVHPHYYMKYLKNSIERYLDMLLGYKEKFLLPHRSRYDSLIGQLRTVDSEKWLISFFQMPLLPKFSSRNRQLINDWVKELSHREWLDELDYTRKLERLQGDIDNVFDVAAADFDHWFREVVRVLYQSGVTFHSVFLPPDPETGPGTTGKSTPVKASIESGMKNRLKEMARLTGGTFSDLETDRGEPGQSPSLEKEDVYYTLTYSSQNPGKNNAKIEVNQPHFHVVYDHDTDSENLLRLSNPETVPASSISIEHMAFKDKKLSLILGGFVIDQTQKEKGQGVGKLNVRVRIADSQERVVFDKEKALLAQKEKVSLTLDFKWLKKGSYEFVVDANDLTTRKAWTQVSTFEVR